MVSCRIEFFFFFVFFKNSLYVQNSCIIIIIPISGFRIHGFRFFLYHYHSSLFVIMREGKMGFKYHITVVVERVLLPI
jgi:hypothetical protein